MRFLRTPSLCLFAIVAFPFATAQSPAPTVRIIEKIDNSQLVALKGNTVPFAHAASDRGRVNPALPMSNLLLVLTRGPEQQAAFDEFVGSQYDSSSPNFHRWLLPSEVGERFGPSLNDVVTLTNWLTSRGFSVAGVAKDRMTISFSGTAGQVQSAFHTEIHTLWARGEQHIANMSDPQIPMALAPVLGGVKGLHDFRPKPLHKLGGTATLDRETGHWKRASSPSALAGSSIASPTRIARPDFGTIGGSTGNTYTVEDVSPYDFATIYNVLPLWNATTPINGAGQTIAVVGTSDIALSDVATFRSQFKLPAGPTPIQVPGVNGIDPGVCTSQDPSQICTINDLIENSLDVEWSGAVATGAQIVLVTAGQSTTNDAVYDAASYVIQNVGVSGSPLAGAHILNVSYGLCELGEGTSGNAAYNNLWQTAATEGVAVFVASGDGGSASCDQGGDANGVPYAAQYGLSVSGLASTPYDTAVGGTDLNWGTAAAPYWNTTNATNGASAVGYMPEVPWNDTCTNPVVLAFLQTQVKPALVQQGFSPANPTDAESSCQFIITWNPTLTSVFGVDLSTFVDTVGAGGGVSSCTTSDGQTAASCTGGYAKPSWQANVTGIPTDGKRDIPDVSFFASNGFLSSAYLICVTAALPSTGPTSCTYSPTQEVTAEEVGGTSVASPAMAGVMALINQKIGRPQGNPNAELYALAASQNYASCSTETATTASACYFNDIDAGTGSYSGTISTPCQPTTPNCTANHAGDTVAALSGYSSATGFDLATGLGSLNVANVVNAWTSTTGIGTATVTLTPTATSLTVEQSINVAVTVAGSGAAPSGTVTLVGGGFLSGAQTLASGSHTFTLPAFGINGGTDTLVASYSGDSNYGEANASTTVSVTKVAPGSVAITPAAASFAANVALTVTGTVSGTSGGPAPTGTVTLSGGGYTSAATALANGSYSINVPANSLATGTDTLTANYSGDDIYDAASNTTSVAVAVPPPSTYSVGASGPASGIGRGASATSTVTVSSTTGYAGSITLTCSLNAGGPSNQTGDAPSCSLGTGSSITLSTATKTATATATVTTVAATSGALTRPDFHRDRTSLAGLGVAALVLLALFGIPEQRRAFRAMLGMVALVFALVSLAACGGGGGGSGSGGSGGGTTTTNPGTASGTYTFTVTGTGNPVITPTPTTTFTVTVN
ncbi:MAG TPA: protease pro-enzyme activation domain-containing protein [Terracidiphilus sp.]|nr:protease pro-enzyme activation domain-containing protein [Terracidiphilus sp.]